MKTRSKMILGLASLLGVTAGATAVSGFAWFVTTKTADVAVTNIKVFNDNPSLSVRLENLKGVKLTNDAANNFALKAAKDTTSVDKEWTAIDDQTDFVLTNKPLAAPTVYIDGVQDTTLHTYVEATKTIHFDTAPGAGKKIRATYYDKAALTDVSSLNGKDFYDPIWETANEGKKATKIKDATAGEQYIAFDMVFSAPTTGSLKVYLSQPSIEGIDETNNTADAAAASVARVGFYNEDTHASVLTLSRNTGDHYNKGISKTKVESYDTGSGTVNANTVDGHYTIDPNVLDTCTTLATPCNTDYSVMSSAPTEGTDLANNFIALIGGSDVRLHVTIWLEGTSNTTDGDYSAPIGGEINVTLPIVAFGA